MLKRISFLAVMFAICTYAQDDVETEPAPAEAVEAVETESAPVEAAEAIEGVETETPVEAVETVEAELVPAPAQPAAATTEAPAKEAIIENPIEFAIVTAVFVATVLLIALTGN